MRVILFANLILVLAAPVSAASRLTDVTPATLADQPLTLRVEYESHEDGMIRFEIHVSNGSAPVSSRREGRYVLWAEEVGPREDASGGDSTRPPKRLACRVREGSSGESLCYVVQAHRDVVDRVTFTFRNYDPNGMPAFDGYEFVLGQFVAED